MNAPALFLRVLALFWIGRPNCEQEFLTSPRLFDVWRTPDKSALRNVAGTANRSYRKSRFSGVGQSNPFLWVAILASTADSQFCGGAGSPGRAVCVPAGGETSGCRVSSVPVTIAFRICVNRSVSAFGVCGIRTVLV